MSVGQPATPRVYTVTELNEWVNTLLSEQVGPILVGGEISDVRISRDTWVTFTLKDPTSTISCFGHRRRIGTSLTDGMQVRILGTPRVYVPYGKYSLTIAAVEPVGEGALRQAYELLLAQIRAEGLLLAERKRPLPRFPEHIALITSSDGAALADVRRVLEQRWGEFRLTLVPTAVQGMSAVPELVSALQIANELATVDVIILTRGGGSLEDLQAFNDERVIRAVTTSRVPVVAAIGHERDTTITELVADQRAATPSNAAQLTVPDRETVRLELATAKTRLSQTVSEKLQHADASFEQFYRATERSFMRVHQELELARNRLATQGQLRGRQTSEQRGALSRYRSALTLHFTKALSSHLQGLEHRAKLLESLNPRAILGRGYSYTVDAQSGKMLTSIRGLRPTQQVKTHLSDGSFLAEVKHVES